MIRQPERFETEHHVYSVPMRYRNIRVCGWLECSDAGVELLADEGTITIVEDRPIVEIIVVGSGVSLPNYNAVEWWGGGESITGMRPGQVVKRQRIEGLTGQHPNAYHRDLLGPERTFTTLVEAEDHSAHLRTQASDLTRGFTVPGGLPGRFFESTARFRVGDTSREELNVYRAVIRGGGRDCGDPRNYAFRLIDVVVRKDGASRQDHHAPALENGLPEKTGDRSLYCSPRDDERLGDLRRPEVFETEHRVYTVPFHYENVAADGWFEYGVKGMEIMAEAGSLTVREEKPIIGVTTVGTGCSSPNYNTVDWWDGDQGERWRTAKRLPVTGRLIRRQRVDDLKGQHATSQMRMLLRDLVEPDASEAAKLDMIRKSHHVLADKLYDLSYGHHFPTVSVMNGLYENSAYFRVGDTSRPDQTVHEVVIRGGAWDFEDPYTELSRFPADYTFRLVDVEVRKDGVKKECAPLSTGKTTEADGWTPPELLAKGREVNRSAMIPFPEESHFRVGPGRPYGWVRFAPRSNFELGDMREPEEFEVEHRVYASPFAYENVRAHNPVTCDDSGLHLQGDTGAIVIEEKEPIISVVVVGSGSTDGNYVMVDWYRPGEDLVSSCFDNWFRRIRVDGLDGQCATWLHAALAGPLPEFGALEEAREFLRTLQGEVEKSTGGFYSAAGGVSRLYENTAVFRIGDTSRPDGTPHRVTITAGGLGGPTSSGTAEAHHPADYAIRLVDVAVRKHAHGG